MTFFVKHWILGIAFTTFTLLAIVVIYLLRNFSVKFWEKQRQTSADLYGSIEESLSAIEDIRANKGVDNAMRKFFHYSKKDFRAFRKSLIRDQFFVMAIWSIIAIINTLVFAPSIPLVRNGVISLGTVFLIQVFSSCSPRSTFKASNI